MKLLIGKSKQAVALESSMANRHGIISGATGTGKTVTLQVLAERFSEIGVPVFLADIKGDVSGIAKPGTLTPKLQERIETYHVAMPVFTGFPVQFWDVLGKKGHPIRATIADMGPILLARLLNLSEVQSAVLSLIFTIADDEGLLLLDFKDLKSMLVHVQNNAKTYTQKYGQISTQSVASIQRALLVFEQEGSAQFFAEPMLDIKDFLVTDSEGRGCINILAADELYQHPQLYAMFLLWILAELFEQFPEVGDCEKPRLVFFFDEAHLLFKDMPQVLLQKIEQVVRLIRSKGIGIYFITQSPLDIPESILGQLGNRIQHALRAYTPKDYKAVKTAAETFRKNPEFKTDEVITELGVGEALVSFLDSNGVPTIVERVIIVPPRSQIGPLLPEGRTKLIRESKVFGKYEKTIDRESAYEMIEKRIAAQTLENLITKDGWKETSETDFETYTKKTSRAKSRVQSEDNITEELLQMAAKTMLRSAARSIGSTAGRKIVRGILGSLGR
ncbi:MAG TPA: DUF853 family protein [Spirochaetales bacterium]|nr:DUF853 family protein [Spirochaetales bacterium]HRV29938.1 DUF853 family protein [Spirochaetia bacterium]HOT58275.1 DUF853 family protein [Spirochaetales bacterium]HPD80334.1 DUF853 family protein [Spirochaetales bacterium]HQG39842.1 DUF853 family protein [Spirochaetales bacterium]